MSLISSSARALVNAAPLVLLPFPFCLLPLPLLLPLAGIAGAEVVSAEKAILTIWREGGCRCTYERSVWCSKSLVLPGSPVDTGRGAAEGRVYELVLVGSVEVSRDGGCAVLGVIYTLIAQSVPVPGEM